MRETGSLSSSCLERVSLSESDERLWLRRSRNSFPKDLLNSSAVFPLTCPAKMLPTVLKMTSDSFCP